jgi:hypothetical protein
MAYLEDILPQIRNRGSARRKSWPKCDILRFHDGDDTLHRDDILADDWELVPEPVKHKAKVYLWSDGQLTTRDDRIWVNGDHKVIETREIEWSVE